MTDTVIEVLLGCVHVLGYVGFVLLAGALTFLVVVWPQGHRNRLLVRLAILGIVLTALATVLEPVLTARMLGVDLVDGTDRSTGTAALIRLALLAVLAGFLTDVVSAEVRGVRAASAMLVVVGVAATMLVPAEEPASGDDWLVLAASTGHLAAIAAWVGGLVALATVLVPRRHLDDLHRVLPRFSIIAFGSVAVLVLTGAVHAVVAAGGVRPLLTSSYGAAFAVKVALVALLLGLGVRGRKRASFQAQRYWAQFDDSAAAVGIQVLGVTVLTELALIVAVFAATAVMVGVGPTA